MQNNKNNLIKNDKSEELVDQMIELHRKLDNLIENNRIDVLVHLLMSNGLIDTINVKKKLRTTGEDYAKLNKDDFIFTVKNILTELQHCQCEVDGLIN